MTITTSSPNAGQLPMSALLALSLAAFLALLTEILPAGTITLISAGMDVSESLAGQFITAYAVGSLIAAIPLTAATMMWRRKRLFLCVLFVLLVFNVVTILTDNFAVALVARFMAGVAGAMVWAMLAGYARSMVPDNLKGRALAIAGLGQPLALCIGVPLGTWLGSHFGWRFAFVVLAALSAVAIVWAAVSLPDYPGQAQSSKRVSLWQVFTMPGVRPVLTVLVCWILAHSILYTFIVPFLAPAGMASQGGKVLLAFGLAAIIGIWVTGMLIDGHLRSLVLFCLAAFAVGAAILGVMSKSPAAIYTAIVIWGFTFGGSPALLQTASAETAGAHADVVQSILVTAWNIAIAAGGLVGGIMLDTVGVGAFPWVVLTLLVLGFLVSWIARHHGFPGRSRRLGLRQALQSAP